MDPGPGRGVLLLTQLWRSRGAGLLCSRSACPGLSCQRSLSPKGAVVVTQVQGTTLVEGEQVSPGSSRGSYAGPSCVR